MYDSDTSIHDPHWSKHTLMELFFGTSPPTARRENGMRDARAGIIRRSSDPDYLKGYELGLTLKKMWG